MKRSALRLSTLFFTAVAACAVTFSPVAQAQKPGAKISYITVDHPGALTSTAVNGINNSQEVSGFYYDAMQIGHGYIYNKAAKSKFQIIDVPGAVYVSTVGTVNNRKQFVGEFVDGMGLTHGYIATRP